MIMVMLGTNPYPFTRLAKRMDELAGRLNWDVFMQVGTTPFKPVHCESMSFLSYDEIKPRIEACELLVVQGGAGSIRDGLKANKPVVAVPRYPEQGESPDRQEELVRALEVAGCVIGVYDIDDLESAITRARSFVSARLPENRIPQIIKVFLEHM